MTNEKASNSEERTINKKESGDFSDYSSNLKHKILKFKKFPHQSINVLTKQLHG